MKDIIMLVFIFVIIFGTGIAFIGDCFFQRKKRKVCTEKILAKYKTCKTVNFRSRYYSSERYLPCFSYEYNGQEYHSIAVGSGLKKKKIMEYTYDHEYEVYIDPSNPQTMRISKDGIGGEIARFITGFVLIIFALLFALFVIGTGF